MRPLLLFLALALWTPAAAASAGERHVTADGVTLRTPAVESIGCAEMRDVLDAIDASGYRDGVPKPRSEADMSLLAYENRLSRAFYARCVAPDAGAAAAARGAFEGGFTETARP